MADEKLTAATRIEKLLDNIAGGDNDVTPATRLEKFLSYIADAMEGGGGSGGGGCECNDLIIQQVYEDGVASYTANKTYAELKDVTGGVIRRDTVNDMGGFILITDLYYEESSALYVVTTPMENPILSIDVNNNIEAYTPK